ncbi:MAG: DUF4124 domain-containing protein [Gammaproteobacteria bacterium]|nr:DUF4124 domain-containing protein [Gammaproteobacteria bacterium]MDH4253721.1 DUF4124 domain-containing protein [Gammaproteobacteria bacterium]MDH5309650.1 DUF4124 domain-containing protein [Gammaproteobacteria bacterium]
MRTATSLLAILGLATAFATGASEIYKWTDAEGNVIYGDRPVGDPAERLLIVSKPTNPSQVQAMIDARHEREGTSLEAREKKAEEEKSYREKKAESADRAKQCESSRATLQKYLQSRRLYKLDESGERVYLDEQQMQESRARMQAQVEEYCSP